LPRAPIGTIDPQVCQQLDQRAANGRPSDVSRRGLGAHEAMQRGYDRVALRRKAAVESLAPARLLLAGKILRPAADRLPKLGEADLALWIVLHTRYLVHEIVAGCAVCTPITRQPLAGPEDLLDDQIGSLGSRRGG